MIIYPLGSLNEAYFLVHDKCQSANMMHIKAKNNPTEPYSTLFHNVLSSMITFWILWIKGNFLFVVK
jgi:hypothetical protein